jgi:hypothetical protein
MNKHWSAATQIQMAEVFTLPRYEERPSTRRGSQRSDPRMMKRPKTKDLLGVI